MTRVEMVCHCVCQWCHSAFESVGILAMIPPIRGDVALPPRRHSIKRGATWMLKRRTDADVGCMEDGRDGRIGAMRYAGGNGTRKEAEKRNV